VKVSVGFQAGDPARGVLVGAAVGVPVTAVVPCAVAGVVAAGGRSREPAAVTDSLVTSLVTGVVTGSVETDREVTGSVVTGSVETGSRLADSAMAAMRAATSVGTRNGTRRCMSPEFSIGAPGDRG